MRDPKGGRQLKKVIIPIVAVAVVVVAVVAITKSRKPKIPEMRIVTVEKGNITKAVVATGEIRPLAVAEVKSKIGGVVRKFYVEEGQPVTRGQKLAEIVPTATPEELVAAREQVKTASAQVTQSNRNVERLQGWHDGGIVEQRRLQRLRRAFAEIECGVRSIRGSVEEEPPTAEVPRARVGHRQCECGGHRRIDGSSTSAQDRTPDGGRLGFRSDDHPASSGDGPAGRRRRLGCEQHTRNQSDEDAANSRRSSEEAHQSAPVSTKNVIMPDAPVRRPAARISPCVDVVSP